MGEAGDVTDRVLSVTMTMTVQVDRNAVEVRAIVVVEIKYDHL